MISWRDVCLENVQRTSTKRFTVRRCHISKHKEKSRLCSTGPCICRMSQSYRCCKFRTPVILILKGWAIPGFLTPSTVCTHKIQTPAATFIRALAVPQSKKLWRRVINNFYWHRPEEENHQNSHYQRPACARCRGLLDLSLQYVGPKCNFVFGNTAVAHATHSMLSHIG